MNRILSWFYKRSPEYKQRRQQSLQMWREQGARLAQKERQHVLSMYDMYPTLAPQLYGHATATDALSDSESLYQQFVRQSQDEWD